MSWPFFWSGLVFSARSNVKVGRLDGEAGTHVRFGAFQLFINSPVGLNDLLLYFWGLQLLHGLLLDWRNLILPLKTEVLFICQTQFCLPARCVFCPHITENGQDFWIFFGIVQVARQTMSWKTICFETAIMVVIKVIFLPQMWLLRSLWSMKFPWCIFWSEAS